MAALAEAPLDLLEQAREGILFLHEVGDLNRMEQKGLLLLLAKIEKYNARLICASAKPLAARVAQGTFDERLYSTIARVTLHVPNLRDHREDILDLAHLFLLRCVEAQEVAQRSFSTAALNALRNFDWPGNLVQLESTVRSLALTAAGEEISLLEVNQALAQFGSRPALAQGLQLDVPLREARDAFERLYFEHHMSREGGNMSRVADTVGLERTHLYRKLKQLGIKLSRRADE
jgi:DNA-binding NtrC family response regulator